MGCEEVKGSGGDGLWGEGEERGGNVGIIVYICA